MPTINRRQFLKQTAAGAALASLAGLPVPGKLDGTDLTPVLRDPAASVRFAAMSQYFRRKDKKPVMGYTFRSRRYRYTVWIQKDYKADVKHGPVVGEEFYDYETDPYERQSLVSKPEYAETVRRFKEFAKKRGVLA